MQYFPDLKILLGKLLNLIKENGEIHIIDSPIYTVNEAIQAKQRTRDYYLSLGFPEMSNNYYHHNWNEFRGFKYKLLYNPLSVIKKLRQLIVKDSPFPWIKISK